VADALQRALNMPLPERRDRWRAMMKVLEHNDITFWRTSFLSALTEKAPVAQRRVAETLG
jgi:trehalose 6-phosphate synthase